MINLYTLAKEIFEAPARSLDRTIETVQRDEKALISKKPFRVAEEYFNNLGPGLVTGAADDDPSGIATYSQAGARYGFQLLWLSLFTFPFMSVVQEMCGRIGMVTGRGLASNIRRHFSARVLSVVTVLLFVANTLNISADLGAMGASMRLLVPGVSVAAWVTIFATGILLLQVFTTYARYSKILKYLTLALLSYVFTAFAVRLNWGDALRHVVVPSLTFSKSQLFLLCAILGTTISPYLFFWQTSQEIEEDVLKGERTITERQAGATDQELVRMRRDTWSGMLFSNLIMFFIIAACAATLHAHGVTTITTADQAAAAIRPFGGTLTYFFFAVGIVGTGLLAIPTLAGSTAYATAESFGWRQGLYLRLRQAYAFYGVIIVSMLVGIVANYLRLDPIRGLIYSGVANGLLVPVVLFFVVRMSGSRAVMGDRANGRLVGWLGWLITGFMVVSGIAAIVSIFM